MMAVSTSAGGTLLEATEWWTRWWDRVLAWLVSDGLRVVLTIVLALFVRWLAHRAISRVVALMTAKTTGSKVTLSGRAGRVLAQASGLAHARHVQRVTTLGSLLRSVVTFTVGLIALLTIMALMGLPLGPLLASAGVGGVALGFGAQSLVKDFLSGVFMILEDQYGVGDVIDTGVAVGTVEEVGLRVTRIVDAQGVIWYVRNGEITRIGNRSQGWSTAIVDSPVSYAADAEQVIAVIKAVATDFDADPAWEDRLLDAPQVVGVESVSGAAMTIRTIAKCAPNASLPVQRELRERIKSALDAAGIKGPSAAPYTGPSAP